TNMLVDESVTIGTNAQAPDIFVNAPFGWTSANGLTLQAIGNVVVNKAVSDSGPAPLSLTYDANGGGGALSFGDKGHISFASTGNTLTINGQGYILANNIQTLAQLIARNPSGSFALSASYNARHDGKYTQSPIQTTFQGNFEGLGNTISKLTVQDETGDLTGGLFSIIGDAAYVANAQVIFNNLTGPTCVGGFAAQNSGYLSGVTVTGPVSAVSNAHPVKAGGVVCENDGTISSSSASVTVDAEYP